MIITEPGVDYEYPFATTETDAETLAILEQRIQTGEPSRVVLRNLAHRENRLAGEIAEYLTFGFECGIPLAPTVTWLRLEYSRKAEQRRHTAKAMRTPAITAQIVNWLPWGALLLAQLIGIPAVTALVFSVPGWVVLVVSAVLGIFGSRTSAALIKEALSSPPDLSFQYQLLALASERGVGLRKALASLQSCVTRLDPDIVPWCMDALKHSLPVVSLLRLQAERKCDEYQHQLDLKIEVLPIRLLAPIAIFVIPQFLLLLVAPQLLAVIGLIN